jgi:serine/threonine-protein kinase
VTDHGIEQGRITLMRPSRPDSAGASSVGLPTDLLSQSAERLRTVALVYAVVFFLAGVVPIFINPVDRVRYFHTPLLWAPSLFGISMALVLAAIIRRIPLATAMNLGLAFEILGSYAIAASEFGDPLTVDTQRGFLGLSWVTVWVMMFTIVVPTTPRRALLTALASVSSVGVVIGFLMITGATTRVLEPFEWFLGLVFPYILVAGMAWIGARVVYQLGREVKRARDLGSYSLEEKLGEGGMGEVWRAKHRLLARPAAIKLIRRSRDGSGESIEAVRRFQREAQAIASLRSPHTVDLFDFGVAEDGTFYYVMELLDGIDTDSLVRRYGPVPPARVIAILRQLLHSLSEAHASGLVHRDIKPANVFLCRYGEEFDFVKVLDFGIVGTVSGRDERNPRETRDGGLRGTPAFLAPEQAMGGEVDGRADIYATGCLAYWLLTGQLVFTAENTVALVFMHAQSVPDRPSTRVTQPIPTALEDLVLCCLAKSPADRPSSARDLLERLNRIEGAGDWTQEHARAWWQGTHPATGARLRMTPSFPILGSPD